LPLFQPRHRLPQDPGLLLADSPSPGFLSSESLETGLLILSLPLYGQSSFYFSRPNLPKRFFPILGSPLLLLDIALDISRSRSPVGTPYLKHFPSPGTSPFPGTPYSPLPGVSSLFFSLNPLGNEFHLYHSPHFIPLTATSFFSRAKISSTPQLPPTPTPSICQNAF